MDCDFRFDRLSVRLQLLRTNGALLFLGLTYRTSSIVISGVSVSEDLGRDNEPMMGEEYESSAVQ